MLISTQSLRHGTSLAQVQSSLHLSHHVNSPPWVMSSSEGSSDMKTGCEFHEDESESLPDLEAQGALASDPSLSSVAPTHSGPRVKSVTFKKCNIRDRNQQVLVLEGGVLKAVPDKDVTARETFYISVSHRRVVKPMNEEKNHIFLAVSKGELCLYCDKVKRPKHPSLQLKKKHIKELSSLEAKDCLPFTFLKEQVDSYFTLESAANPGYFIYTSNKPGQPIGMTKELGQEKNIHFQFQEAKMELNTVQD